MPPKEKAGGKSKQIQASKSAAKSSGAKGARKKWSKGKSREKLNNMVLFDKDTYAKLMKEVPTSKVITTATVSERMKCNGSLARRAIKELLSKGLIRQVIKGHCAGVYTKAN